MKNLDKMIKISLLSAIAALLMYVEFSILPAFPFLKLDLGEVPVLISAFAFGPIAGVITEGLKILIKALINPGITMGIGELSNFIVGSALLLPAAIIYQNFRTKKSAIVGMAIGAISMTVVGFFSNQFLIVPMYVKAMGAEGFEAFIGTSMMGYLLSAVIPFNLIKAVVSGIVTYIVYKRVSKYIRRETMMIDGKKIS